MPTADEATSIDIENPGDAAAELKAALFALLTSDGSALFTENDFNTAIAEYLKTSDAATLYETLSDIQNVYLTIADAAATYATLTDAALLETIEHAAATYETIENAAATYVPLGGGTVTGTLTLNTALQMNGVATAFRGTHYTTANVLRFNVGIDGTESGNSSGSDYHIYVYNDAGVFQGAAITITRATLDVNFLQRPTWATFTPWDSGNFDPSVFSPTSTITATYETIAHAAATYLTKADAEQTYTTPSEVDAALATFETSAHATATYRTLGNATFNNQTAGNSNVPALIAQSGDGHNFVFLYPEVVAGNAPVGVPDFALSTVALAGDAALMTSVAHLGGFTIGMNGTVGSPSAAAIRFSIGNAGASNIDFGVRPKFNGNIIWDAGNFAPSSYLTIANAATTYLTQANAASTYLTTVTAAATYATIANLALKAPIANPTFTGTTTTSILNLSAAAGTWKPISFNTGNSQRWQLGSNNTPETGANVGSDFDIFCYGDNGAVLANAVHISRATCIAQFSMRPTFNGNTAYDTGNLPAALTTALAPYLLKAGGAVTGATSFAVTPTISATAPAASDSTTKAATTAWAQSAIAAAVGTGGPFIPTSGIGMPYDVVIPYNGPSTPTTPYTAGTRILQYVFTRKVVFPAGFAGSFMNCLRQPAATSQQITIVGSAQGGLGGVVFDTAHTAGIFANQPSGTITFNPGDVLQITTATTDPVPDTLLAGIYGTLRGTIAA